MTEFSKEDRERLVRVEDNVENYREDLKEIKDDLRTFISVASGPVGFPRCAARSVEWDNIKKHQARVENFITWFYRGLVVLALTLLLSEGYTYAKVIIKAFSSVTPSEFP